MVSLTRRADMLQSIQDAAAAAWTEEFGEELAGPMIAKLEEEFNDSLLRRDEWFVKDADSQEEKLAEWESSVRDPNLPIAEKIKPLVEEEKQDSTNPRYKFVFLCKEEGCGKRLHLDADLYKNVCVPWRVEEYLTMHSWAKRLDSAIKSAVYGSFGTGHESQGRANEVGILARMGCMPARYEFLPEEIEVARAISFRGKTFRCSHLNEFHKEVFPEEY